MAYVFWPRLQLLIMSITETGTTQVSVLNNALTVSEFGTAAIGGTASMEATFEVRCASNVKRFAYSLAVVPWV